jgi:hypothetical protein
LTFMRVLLDDGVDGQVGRAGRDRLSPFGESSYGCGSSMDATVGIHLRRINEKIMNALFVIKE